MILSSHAFADKTGNFYELALKNYKACHYRKALYYFENTPAGELKDEKAKLTRYAIDIMNKFKRALLEIEKEEVDLRRRPFDTEMKRTLSEKHYLFAEKLLGKEFYLPIVEPHLKRTIELEGGNIKAQAYLANTYYASMQYEKAIKAYEKIIAMAPANFYAYEMAGDACVAIGDFDKAKKLYTEFLKINAKAVFKYDPLEVEKVKEIIKVLPETYKDIDNLLKEERLDEAEFILKKRVSLNGADYIALTFLGNIYQEKGDRNRALRFLKEAVRIAPDYPLAHLFLGRLYFIMRNYDEALAELDLFKEKMKKLPKMDKETRKMYIDSLYYLSEVYFTLKRYEESLKQSEEIIEMDPKEQAAYYNLGVYYYSHEHNRSKAYQSFIKVLELDSTNSLAKEAKYAIEFIRNNPDSRMAPDFSFIDREYRD